MKHEEITHKIIGCAMKVHSTLGNGFQEVIYQRALAIEMEMTLFYEGIDSGTRRVDFFLNEISKQISLVNEQLEETRTIKKALLSKLFC